MYKCPSTNRNLESQTLNNILPYFTHSKVTMIYSGIAAKLLEADNVDYSSGAAALPVDGLMDQFETVNPQDPHYQPDTDYLVSDNYTPDPGLFPNKASPQEDFFYPLDPENEIPYTDFQPNTNLEQTSGALYQLQAVQDPTYIMGTHTCNQHTPSLEQAPYPPNQSQDRQDSRNGIGLSEESLSESLDQQFQNLQDSLQAIEDFDSRFSHIPVSQFTKWDQYLEMANQLQNSPKESTTHFPPKMNPIDEFTTLGPTDNGSIYHFQASPGELATLSHASSRPIYQSPQPQGKFAIPAPIWNNPSPGVEQTLIVKGSFPQAPHPSIHIPPNNQHLSAKNRQPPTPRKEEKRLKASLSKQKANIESIDPSKYYQQLSKDPHSWKPRNDNSMLTFQYNEYGELATNKFSPNQIDQYLYDHPLNYDRNGVYVGKNTRLTLWIQVTPADSGRRYPSASSDKCRFVDCPIPRNTIRKGFFRVAFDEHTASGRQIDPYHCAGFVHLFCLEKFCDFPDICHNLNVLPDQRNLPEGKNKMAITRDHEEMFEVVKTFIQSSQKPMSWDYKQTLCFRLTSKHLELEPIVRDTTRKKRGGNNIALHKGDLDKFMEGENHKLALKRGAPPAQKPQTPKRKRETAGKEEDIANLDENKHQQPPIKRM